MIINKLGVAVIGSYPGTAQICQRLFAVSVWMTVPLRWQILLFPQTWYYYKSKRNTAD